MCESGKSGTKSRKQRDNLKKKNNQRMIKRKADWEEKRRTEETEGGAEKKGEADDAESDKKGDNGMAASVDKPAEDAEAEADVDAEVETSVGGYKKFTIYPPPPAWDRDALLARAKETGLVHFPAFRDVPEEGHFARRVRGTCFPPTAEEASRFHLDRCMRCLPHDMDTGGFFVALFRKVRPVAPGLAKRKGEVGEPKTGGEEVVVVPAAGEDEGTEAGAPVAKRAKSEEGDGGDGSDEKAVDAPAPGEGEPIELVPATEEVSKGGSDEKGPIKKGEGRRSGGRPNSGRENFVPVSSGVFPDLIKFYGLEGIGGTPFPRDQFMCRGTGDSKVVYFIGKSVKEKLIDLGIQDRVVTISSGLKAFERNNKECDVLYRVAQEGIQFVAPYMSDLRRVVADTEDFVSCIGVGGLSLENMSEGFRDKVKGLKMGSFVVALRGYETDVSRKMFLVMWKCRGDHMNCLVAKMEMDGMRSKLRALGWDGKERETADKWTGFANEKKKQDGQPTGDDMQDGEPDTEKDGEPNAETDGGDIRGDENAEMVQG